MILFVLYCFLSFSFSLFSGIRRQIGEEDFNYLKKWMEDLPTVDSHYCRKTPTYQNKKFLYPGTTIASLHRHYSEEAEKAEKAEKAGMRVVSETLFSKHFHSENYYVFIPRKDQCDVCVSYKHHNISQAEYEVYSHPCQGPSKG